MGAETLKLLKSIDSSRLADNDFIGMVELARLNKVLLGFLRRIGYNGPLRIMEENRYRQYMDGVAEVAKIVKDFDYALFKFRKPIEHVSVDIDILIHDKHLWEAAKRLARTGFRIEVSEPYTITMIRGETIVDLYTHPSFAWITYLDGEKLLEEAETIEVNGVKAKALTTEVEAIAAAAHAIYKEHMYLLTDYYVTKQWVTGKTLNLARELRAYKALQISLELNRQIEEGKAETPLKLNQARTAKTLITKFMEDPNFRATSINILKLATRKRTVQQIIGRMKRKTY